MAMVLPIPLPESLVTERRVVAKHDFTHKHHTVAFGPDGRGYVHSEMFYNYRRYNQGDDDLSATIVTLLSPEFSITRQVWLEELHHEMTHAPMSSNPAEEEYVFNNSTAPLAVTERGEVVFTTSKNRTFIYDADIAHRLARFDPLRGERVGYSDVVGVPRGVIVVRDRDEIYVANALVAPQGPPTANLLFDAEQLPTGMRSYLGRYVALDRERVLVAQFVARGRSGWIDTAAFSYTVVGPEGVVGKLPLGAADTPYGKTWSHDDSYAAHRQLGGWLVRSEHALHVFDRDGARALRIGLADDERFEAVVPLTLSSVGPNGELIMIGKKHHVIVVSDPVDAVGSIEAVLAEVGAVYAAEIARLKKAVPWSGGRWFGFEAKTPRAAAKAAKKTKKPKAAAIVEPLPAAATPAEAVALAPHDVETLSVYADSLSTSDAALGEYINTSIQLHRMTPDDPERVVVDARARSLFKANGPRWTRTWNTPTLVLEERYAEFCGLPCGISLEGVPSSLADLDAQLTGLPIQTLRIGAISTRDLAKLEGLATLRRISELLVVGSRKHKLAKPALAWLAAQALANVKKLHLYSVIASGSALRDVLDTMPDLDTLTVMSGELSADGLELVASSAAAARIECLYLGYNPLGSAAAPLFAGFPRLDKVDLGHVDLGDDVADLPPPQMMVTKLDVAGNPRLGLRGMRWLVAAMPQLREVTLPDSLAPDGIAAIVPIASQLEAIDASWMDLPAKRVLVDTVIARAPALRRLDLTGDGGGLAREIVKHTQLDKLELGTVDHDDLAALAGATTVSELGLGDGANDEAITALARTAKLPNLRTLHVHSHDLTEQGIRALLRAEWPRFSRLELMYARIGSAEVLDVPDRPFVLRLFKCEISKTQLAHLRRAWGERLVT
jgi:hypothetical protein